MTKAQQTWAYLTALFLAASVVLYTVPTAKAGVIVGSICLGVSLIGWLGLWAMIDNDSKAVSGD